jgi:hypothetical protein
MSLVTSCLMMDPERRPTAAELLVASLFAHDNFNTSFNQVHSKKDKYEAKKKRRKVRVKMPLIRSRTVFFCSVEQLLLIEKERFKTGLL